METTISAREYKLAKAIFSDKQIAVARKKADPVEYLVKSVKTSGVYSPEEIFPGCLGYEIKNGAVTCIGPDADGRLNFQAPIYRSSLNRLAHVALIGMYQIAIEEMLQ